MLYTLTLVAATFAATVYTIWAARWFRARAWGSAIANAFVALLMMTVGVGHGAFAGAFSDTWIAAAVPLLFVMPALARLAELGRSDVVSHREIAASHRLAAYIRQSEKG